VTVGWLSMEMIVFKLRGKRILLILKIMMKSQTIWFTYCHSIVRKTEFCIDLLLIPIHRIDIGGN
jgi:hypothetical protein